MIPRPDEYPAAPAAKSGFAEFRQAVLDDPALQGQLADLADFSFHPADVEAALRAAHRAWIERWIA
jgi:hypothetical protein